MKKTYFALLGLGLMLAFQLLIASELPSVTHYSLAIRFLLKEERIETRAEMTLQNTTDQIISEIPFLLYRLLEVETARDENGKPLTFSQQIVRAADAPSLQMNLVKVQLGRPLSAKTSTKVTLRYNGFVYGYREVWGYVRDSIREDYALVRQDTFSYPIVALPSQQSLRRILQNSFTYDLQATVPSGYTVATGGQLKEVRSEGDSITFVYQNPAPYWRMDIAVAKFSAQKDEQAGLSVYVLPGHEQGAERVLKAIKDVIALYSKWFGQFKDLRGYTVIEIPEGWGSQSAALYILQTAAAFENPKRISEVYHEVAHNWNVKAKPAVQRCRYFDEAFASYFDSLATRAFQGVNAFEDDLEKSRKYFMTLTQKDKRNYETPIADYGKYEIGGLSYTKGAWSLYVLHQLVGEDAFFKTVREFLTNFTKKEADFKDFQQTAEKVAQRNLSKFFDEWIYGAESSRLLAEQVPIDQIVSRYR